MQPSGWNLGSTTYAPLIARQNLHDNAEFDITAMIDLVFMMNIYFLVTFLTAALGEVDLPSARHVTPLDVETAVVLTVMESLSDDLVTVYLADGTEGEPLQDADAQDREIRVAVEQGAATGKTAVLIKAERHVCLRELFRIMSAATIPGIRLHVAVMEMDGPS